MHRPPKPAGLVPAQLPPLVDREWTAVIDGPISMRNVRKVSVSGQAGSGGERLKAAIARVAVLMAILTAVRILVPETESNLRANVASVAPVSDCTHPHRTRQVPQNCAGNGLCLGGAPRSGSYPGLFGARRSPERAGLTAKFPVVWEFAGNFSEFG